MDSLLADEGVATVNNIKVRREIIANGGLDIGTASHPNNHAVYDNAYDQYIKDGSEAKARQTIGV